MSNEELYTTFTSDKIKYKFHQYIAGMIAFAGDIELKFQNIIPGIPVYFQNTGNLNYWLNTKFEEIDEKEIYQKVPRIVLNLEELQFQTDQDSNQYNKIEYNLEDKNYVANVRRKATEITIDMNFVCSNMVKLLEYFEVCASIFSKDNVFTYEWLGNTYDAGYQQISMGTDRSSLDVNSQTKTPVIKMMVSLILQPLIIRPDTIQASDDIGFDSIKYNLDTGHDNTIDHNDKVIVTPEDFNKLNDKVIFPIDKKQTREERKAKRNNTPLI